MQSRRLFLVSVLSAGALVAKTEKTSLKVVVKNQYGKPVDNAAVILDFLGGRKVTKLGMKSKIHWEVRTNLEGIASFPPVPEGTVQLQVITKKYQTYGNKIELEGAEKTLDVMLNPPQNQYSAHEPLKPKTENEQPPKQ